MITVSIIDDFVARVNGPALRQGTRYAREARVTGFSGTLESVTTVVRGTTSDHEVALWSEAAMQHRCDCPSWRDPCRHQVAAVLVLRQILASGDAEDADARVTRILTAAADSEDAAAPPLLVEADPEEARRTAREERILAARREKLVVQLAVNPQLLAQAVAAVAPALPKDHRRSLATVFRALADVLEEGCG